MIVDVSDEDKHAMGDAWICIGHETSEQLAVRQREYSVKAIKRKKYVRKFAKPDEVSDAGIRLAPPAPVLLPRRCNASKPFSTRSPGAISAKAR